VLTGAGLVAAGGAGGLKCVQAARAIASAPGAREVIAKAAIDWKTIVGAAGGWKGPETIPVIVSEVSRAAPRVVWVLERTAQHLKEFPTFLK
jgi:hypothetical protein